MNVAFCRIRYHATDKSLDRLDTMLRLAVIFRVVLGTMMLLDTKTLTEVINNLPIDVLHLMNNHDIRASVGEERRFCSHHK